MAQSTSAVPNVDKETEAVTQLGLLKTLQLDAVEAMAVPVLSKTGEYLVQISQMHRGYDKASLATIRHTVLVQKDIASILSEIKNTQTSVRVCPEGVYATERFLEERNLEKEELAKLKEDVRAVKSSEAMKILSSWRDWFIKSQRPGYAQQMHLYGASVVADSGTVTDSVNLKRLRQLNPFGKDIFYYGGGEKYLYATGVLKDGDFRACEDESISSKGSQLLSKDDVKPADLEKLFETREDYIVESVARQIKAEPNKPKIIVLMMGAMHDFTNNIVEYNKRVGGNLGYIQISPSSLEKALEHISK